jgi:hypothetical protein
MFDSLAFEFCPLQSRKGQNEKLMVLTCLAVLAPRRWRIMAILLAGHRAFRALGSTAGLPLACDDVRLGHAAI